MKQFLFTILCFFAHLTFTHSQSIIVTGTLQDANSKEVLADATVEISGQTATTDENGFFKIELASNAERFRVNFSKTGFDGRFLEVEPQGKREINLGIISMSNNNVDRDDRIPVISLSDEDLESDNFSENVSGILSASNDVFLEAAAFRLSAARFRVRGYDSENTSVFMNGVPMNELENGRTVWSIWGGLNDVMRNRETDYGLTASSIGFGGVGGISSFDTRASNQRVQKRFSYYFGNRSYNHRIMGAYSTGMMQNGWAFSFSGSRRWADEGYLPGTSYDAWAYFASIDRKLTDKQTLNLTVFGSPNKRGRPGSSIEEVYDLVGTNYYNPYWGYQNNEKRNTRVATSHQPTFMLRHDLELGENATLTTAASYQIGKYGTTALEWFDAPDPRPDYYRKLPSYFALDNAEVADQVRRNILANPGLMQINWEELYNINRTHDKPYYQNIEGQQSQYIIESRRYDSRKFNFNTNYENILSDNVTINFGLSYQYYKGHTFKEVEDLLGGDYYVNIDKFATFDNLSGEALQYDLVRPDRIVQEGDIFGYDFEPHVRKFGSWLQGQFSFDKFDAHLSVNVSHSKFWRHGNFQSGRFPDNSLGDSKKHKYLNYAFKGGLTYKIDNRNFLYANAMYSTRAPYFRNAWVANRSRDEIVTGLKEETIYSAEAGYIVQSANLKARATAYFTRFEDQVDVNIFFSNLENNNFITYVLSGVDKQHMGVELAAEAKLSPEFSVSAVAAIGQNIYTSRPNGVVSLDDAFTIDKGTVFIKNFNVPGSPQSAYSFSLNYNAPKYWFAEISVNYFDRFYLDFSPERRIADATYGLTEGSDLYNEIVNQTQTEPGFTVDLFGGKSWRFEGNKFLYLTIGISNIFNNQNLTSGGFEQGRFDRRNWVENGVNLFPERTYYAFGTNFFAMLALRI